MTRESHDGNGEGQVVELVTAGVPKDEVLAKDHIQVRAKLVRRLGGANQALVWSRIHFRADPEHRAAEEVEGGWWWQASYALLAEETGLTEKQSRDAIDSLLEGGYIDRRAGKGRAFLYRAIVVDAASAHLPSGADTAASASDPTGRYIGPGGQIHLPPGAVTPLIDKEDVKDTPVVPTGRSARMTSHVADLFEEAWRHWPRKESKKKARDRFLALADPRGVALAIVQHGDAHGQHTPVQFVPHLTTWLNQERWNDPLPQPREGKASVVEHGRAVDEILRQRGGQREIAS